MSLSEVSSNWELLEAEEKDPNAVEQRQQRLEENNRRLQIRVRELEATLFDRLQLIKKLMLERESK